MIAISVDALTIIVGTPSVLVKFLKSLFNKLHSEAEPIEACVHDGSVYAYQHVGNHSVSVYRKVSAYKFWYSLWTYAYKCQNSQWAFPYTCPYSHCAHASIQENQQYCSYQWINSTQIDDKKTNELECTVLAMQTTAY